MFAVLGDIEFELLIYWDGFDTVSGMDYAEHARIAGKPGLQFIGEKLDEVNISLVFHNHYCQPDAELARLRAAMSAHQALALVFGNGDYRGWFVITGIRATSQQTDRYGNVQALNAELTLREYIGDPQNPLMPPAVSGNEPNIDAWADNAEVGFTGSEAFNVLSDVTAGMNAAASALDRAGQSFDALSSSVAALKSQAEELENALADVLHPLREVTRTLKDFIPDGGLADSIQDVRQCATRIYDEISQAQNRLTEATIATVANVCAQASTVVRQSRSLVADCSSAVSRLASAVIIRRV